MSRALKQANQASTNLGKPCIGDLEGRGRGNVWHVEQILVAPVVETGNGWTGTALQRVKEHKYAQKQGMQLSYLIRNLM